MASAEALRENHASKHIQFWWRVVMDCRKEKHAALVIERFFSMVKEEVDKEIERVARKKQIKRPCQRKYKENDDSLLERVWLNTLDETHVEALYFPPSSRSDASRSNTPGPQRGARARQSFSHLASSPSMKLVMRHESGEDEPKLRKEMLNLNFGIDGTEVLAVPSSPSRKSRKSQSELSDDLSLEEAFLDTAVRQGKERSSLAEKYIRKYGNRTSRDATTNVHHFFADDLSTASSAPCIRYSVSPSTSLSQKKVSSPASAVSSASSSLVHQAYKRVLLKTRQLAESPDEPSVRKIVSPRHGKIRLMNHHIPDYSTQRISQKFESEYEEYLGEEFGLI
jgi:hypothetical protein